MISWFLFLRWTHRLLQAWVAQSACYGRISPGCHKPASLPHSSTETKPCGNPHPPPIPTKSSLAPICSWPNLSVLLKATFLKKRITAMLSSHSSSPANLLGNAGEGRKEDEKQAESNQGGGAGRPSRDLVLIVHLT